MRHYLTILCNLCEINQDIIETPGKNLMSDIQKGISSKVYGHATAFMIKITAPERALSLFDSLVERDIDFLAVTLDLKISEAGRRLPGIQSKLYKESLKEKVIDNNEYLRLVSREIVPVRIYARDSNNAIPLLDDAFELFKAKKILN